MDFKRGQLMRPDYLFTTEHSQALLASVNCLRLPWPGSSMAQTPDDRQAPEGFRHTTHGRQRDVSGTSSPKARNEPDSAFMGPPSNTLL